MKTTKFNPNLFIWLIMTSVIILITSCDSNLFTEEQANSNSPIIEIEITDSETEVLETDTIAQNNCNGTAEVENTIEEIRTVEYRLETQNGIEVNANGQIGFAGTDVELGATVASSFGQSYGKAEALSRSITVKAGKGSNMQHFVRQSEVWNMGQAKITVGTQAVTIPFKYRSDFKFELVNSKNLGDCKSSSQNEGNETNNQQSSTGTIATNIFQGSVLGTPLTEVFLNLEENQVIIGTADKYQTTKDQLQPPFAVFVIYGPVEEKISLPWGGWDQWLNATPDFIRDNLEINIQKTKDGHSGDWMSRGINIYQCTGGVTECIVEAVPTN